MNKFIAILAFFVLLTTVSLRAQTEGDTLQQRILNPVTIQGYRFYIHEVKELGSVYQTYIVAGKKHEVITVNDLPANIAEKTGRQIFAKIPGAFVYDMDGSGNQVNIATRGLDPHRSWEYNVRQNGIMTNSDIYGYPASHYSPPMEAIQKIEVIRGAASLQYGSQFGGMINYVTKSADTTRRIGYESQNSVGSFGLLSTYQALGGKVGRLTWYGYYQKRVSDGYRDNAKSDAQAQFVSLKYDVSRRLSLKGELGRNQYLYQAPGPLTDAMFYENPRQATRSRNYFNPDIYLPSLELDWKINASTQFNWTTSAVLGQRNSVQFIGFADARDTISATTLKYAARQVDIDGFNSYATEGRLKHDYRFLNLDNTVITGVRYVNNDLHRRQQGKGTTGTDFDLSVTNGQFGRDIHFKTQNIAVFIENLFKISSRLEMSAGLRFENGESVMSGKIAYLPDEKVPQDIARQYLLAGASAQYRLNGENKIYGSWSQAYRPVVFADIIPGSVLEQADPSLEDAFGYNAELGFKGRLFNRLNYDVNFFQMLYQNRIGSQVLADAQGASYIWKTNIGDSRTSGVELYADILLSESSRHKISVFTASSYFDGYYLNGKLRNGNENTDLTGKRLETVPKWIIRNGLQAAYKKFSAILQYSYVADSWSDALNTVAPSANGAKGIVPAYSIWDINASYRVSDNYTLRLGVNNFTNEQYFTKRPTGYPGQGVWSSDGRSIVASVGVRW